MYQFVFRKIASLLGKRYRYACLCGWFGNACSWTDTSDAQRTHRPICPHCFSALR